MVAILKPLRCTFCINTNDSSLAEISGIVRSLSRAVMVRTGEKTSFHVGSLYVVHRSTFSNCVIQTSNSESLHRRCRCCSTVPVRMAPTNTEPRETSPLLPRPDAITEPVKASNGIAPRAGSARIEAEQDGGDIERQTSNGDSSKHQGLPEVRKRMKYIFPAIAIGVRLSSAIHGK
jgi:hypothetical protein